MYFASNNLSVIVKLATGKSNSPSFATARDVMFGTVILCSGQSNMVHPLSYDYNATEQLAAAKLLPNLRLFQVGRQWSNNGSMANSLPLGECLISVPHGRGHAPFAGGFAWSSPVLSLICFLMGLLVWLRLFMLVVNEEHLTLFALCVAWLCRMQLEQRHTASLVPQLRCAQHLAGLNEQHGVHLLGRWPRSALTFPIFPSVGQLDQRRR
jgi:hypothetical protein